MMMERAAESWAAGKVVFGEGGKCEFFWSTRSGGAVKCMIVGVGRWRLAKL